MRNKADNLYQFSTSFPLMMPVVMPAQGMNMAQMQQLMANNQLIMGIYMNKNPNVDQGQINNETNLHKKE